jgi:hypothetical protein
MPILLSIHPPIVIIGEENKEYMVSMNNNRAAAVEVKVWVRPFSVHWREVWNKSKGPCLPTSRLYPIIKLAEKAWPQPKT